MRSEHTKWLSVILVIAVSGLAIPPASAGKEKKKTQKKIKIIKKGEFDKDVEKWIEKKKRGYLGVHLMRITGDLRLHFGAPKDVGVMIGKVVPDSPAAKAGVEVGDIITEVDGKKVKSTRQIQKLIGEKKGGDKASLKVVRDRKTRSLIATVEEKEKMQIEVSKFVRKWPGEEDEIQIEVDTGPFDEAMEHLYEHFEDLGEKKLYRFHEFEGDLEKRLQEMEEKLKALEKKLEGKVIKKIEQRST